MYFSDILPYVITWFVSGRVSPAPQECPPGTYLVGDYCMPPFENCAVGFCHIEHLSLMPGVSGVCCYRRKYSAYVTGTPFPVTLNEKS